MSESTSDTLMGDHFVSQLKCERHGFAMHPAAWDIGLCPWCQQELRKASYERLRTECRPC